MTFVRKGSVLGTVGKAPKERWAGRRVASEWKGIGWFPTVSVLSFSIDGVDGFSTPRTGNLTCSQYGQFQFDAIRI